MSNFLVTLFLHFLLKRSAEIVLTFQMEARGHSSLSERNLASRLTLFRPEGGAETAGGDFGR